MYCADCGAKLKNNTTFHESKKRGKYKLVTYICNTYANHGKEVCSSHSILQRIIEGLVLEDIRARAKRVIEDEDGERQRYLAIKANERKQQTEDESRLLKQAESRLAELDTIISKPLAGSRNLLLPQNSVEIHQSLFGCPFGWVITSIPLSTALRNFSPSAGLPATVP